MKKNNAPCREIIQSYIYNWIYWMSSCFPSMSVLKKARTNIIGKFIYEQNVSSFCCEN